MVAVSNSILTECEVKMNFNCRENMIKWFTKMNAFACRDYILSFFVDQTKVTTIHIHIVALLVFEMN